MLRKTLSEKQQDFLADKLMDTANYAVAGLAFGQLVLDRIRPFEFIFGIVFYLWILSITLRWQRR